MEKIINEDNTINADICGMDKKSVKEYIFGFISTLKITEKQLRDLNNELTKWENRCELAKTKGAQELATEAEKEVEIIRNKQQQFIIEINELKSQINKMLKQLPLLAAKERSIDVNLLEQDILIALGYLPGDENKVHNDRLFSKLEKEASAEAALLELKAKMEIKS